MLKYEYIVFLSNYFVQVLIVYIIFIIKMHVTLGLSTGSLISYHHNKSDLYGFGLKFSMYV